MATHLEGPLQRANSRGRGLAGHPRVGVRLLQQKASTSLSHKIMGASHHRPQASESCPDKVLIQNDYTEIDPLANTLRGLVLFSRSEGFLLLHPDSQALVEIGL